VQSNASTEHIERLELLGVDRVCAVLAVRRPSVYAMIHRGEVQAVRVGRLWRIPRAAVERFVRNGGSRS
jgi:excisionase family DNA binding protein